MYFQLMPMLCFTEKYLSGVEYLRRFNDMDDRVMNAVGHGI